MNHIEKALLLVPHQDDEINLAGNIFNVITSKYELYVVYSSLDQNPVRGDIRKKEAYNACANFGIDRAHITFLGYPDTRPHSGKHFFMEGDKSIISILKEYINELRPAIIFATDYDRHWDHKMLSLAFDEAMGILLKENPDYNPLILKGFCYETGCCGLADYKASKPEPTQIHGEIHSNRSFEWKNRISIYGNKNKPAFIWNTRIYKALDKPKSQLAKLYARCVINTDNVFWIKRSDNLMLHASISSDIGDVSKLNDFMILDTYDIETSDVNKVDFSKGVWKVPNHTAIINVNWNNKVILDRLIFHGSPNQKTDQNIRITVSTCSNNNVCELNTLRSYGRNTEVRFNPINTDHIFITLTTTDFPIELSEIEALYGDDNLGYLAEYTITPDYSDIKENHLIDLINNIGYKLISYKERKLLKLLKLLKINKN